MPELVGPDGDQSKQAEHHRALHTKLMRRWSAQSGLYVFYANQAGKSGPAWFPGLVLVTDPQGQLVAEHLPTEGMVVTAVSRGVLAAACPTGPGQEEDTAGGPVNSAGQAMAVRVVPGTRAPAVATEHRQPAGAAVKIYADPALAAPALAARQTPPNK